MGCPFLAANGTDSNEPVSYWEYINVESLLALQRPKTDVPDEQIFIMYHQINELLFKMILREMTQISEKNQISAEEFTMRLDRISRYFNVLSASFEIMGDGMEKQQYLDFRTSLSPASGFQSGQYRMIEIASTELINLIDYGFRANIDRNTPYEHAFEHMYWQAAGKNYETGEKSLMLSEFEKKYKSELIAFMKERNTTNLYAKFKSLPEEVRSDEKLVKAMRHYDHTVNVEWVMAHLNAAAKYLDSDEETIEATGGSDWKKYMHPSSQRRIFFPELWSKKELEEWGSRI
ncbi:MAG: tryptophan 2,3-dioxygenase family protein [Flavobacteriales bacterium]